MSTPLIDNHSNIWNWNESNQSTLFFNKVQNKLFSACIPDKKSWRNYTGLPLGLSYGALTLVYQISLIGEQLLKGIGNTLGALAPCDDFSFTIGLGQLKASVKSTLYLIIGTPVIATYSLFIIPIMTYLDPDSVKTYYTSESMDISEEVNQIYFDEADVFTEFGI